MDQDSSPHLEHIPGSGKPRSNAPLASKSCGVCKPRQRIGRACDHCRAKKIKCDGRRPCLQCTTNEILCDYNTPYVRGRKKQLNDPKTSEQSTSRLGKQISPLGDFQQSAYTSRSRDGHHLESDSLEIRVHPSSLSSRNSPEPGESDNQGHFVGAASGFAFLLRLQKRLRSNGHVVAPTSIFSLGDAALPEFNELSFMLPQKQEASVLVETYFTISSPTVRFFHRGTVEGWLNELYETGALGNSSRAALLIIMAHATRYIDNTTASKATSASSGIVYFQAAERHLARETGPASLITVQALLLSCFYTVTCTRLSHCWNLFGTTSRLILALGLHRRSAKFSGYQKKAVNCIRSECEKRVFWSAYILDKLLSAIHGRPSAFHDEDIDQDFPTLVDDQHITQNRIETDAQGPFCVMIGVVMHAKLVRIVSRILRLLYGTKPIKECERYRFMTELDNELDAWRKSLPAFLNPDIVDSRLLLPTFQRQNNVLAMAYCHAQVLIYRPCLFSDFGKGKQVPDSLIQANVSKCVSAAVLTADIAGRIVDAEQLYAGSWLAYYHVYCAAVVLYTYTIKLTSQDLSTWINYFRAGERCQSYIANKAVPDSLPHRFQVIMEEYRCEVVRQMKRSEAHCISLVPDQGREGFYSSPELQLTPEGQGFWDSSTALNDNELQSLLEFPDWEQLYPLTLDLAQGPPEWSPE